MLRRTVLAAALLAVTSTSAQASEQIVQLRPGAATPAALAGVRTRPLPLIGPSSPTSVPGRPARCAATRPCAP